MTLKNMTTIKNFKMQKGYEAVDTTASLGASDVAILIPTGGITSVVYQLLGDGKVQGTAMPKSTIENDTAVWEDLTDGAVVNPALTAIRQYNASGTTTLYVRAQ